MESPLNSYRFSPVYHAPRAAGERISVMHLIHTMAYGGIETAVINWLRKLDRTRFDVSLVCFENPGETEAPFVEAAMRAGLHVEKIPWGLRKPLLRFARRLANLNRVHTGNTTQEDNSYATCVDANRTQ